MRRSVPAGAARRREACRLPKPARTRGVVHQRVRAAAPSQARTAAAWAEPWRAAVRLRASPGRAVQRGAQARAATGATAEATAEAALARPARRVRAAARARVGTAATRRLHRARSWAGRRNQVWVWLR